MNNPNEQKGFQLTENGEKLYTNRKRDTGQVKRQKDKNKASLKLPRNSFSEQPDEQDTTNISKTNHEQVLRENESSVNRDRSFQSELYARDEQLAQDIQEALEKDMALSAVSNNIQVIVENGIVTLEGKVATKQEKMIAGDKAVVFAGYGRVSNYLTVTSP